jgi:hypothetical protein
MGMSISRARAETHTTAGEERALQAGIALARQHSTAGALAEASSVKALTSVLETNFASGLTSDILIGRVVSADLLRLQRLTVGITALQGMNPLLEADQERRERLAELLNPCRGALEALRMQTSGLERVAEASNASLRRMAEACAPRIAPMEIGLGLNAIAALGSVGNLAAVTALADLHVPVRIHAVPRLPSQSAPRPGRCRETFLDRAPLSPVPEAPSHPQPTGWMEDDLGDEGGRRVLEQLSRFVRSEEIPSDAREGMSVLITWWKLNGHRISSDQSLEFNRVVQSFIGAQLGLTIASDHHKQLNRGLLVPLSERRQKHPAVELDPRIYTSLDLSKILNYNDSTIRRQAETAWTKAGGLEPCPLKRGSNWYVVEAAEDGGGQKRGWKFQRLSECQEI